MAPNGLSIINPHPTRQPGPGLLHQLVQPPGDSTALDNLENNKRLTLSYQELHERADALALQITQRRRQLDDSDAQFVVPVLIRQSPLLYVSLLAILKAGGSFCPLNIDAPPERVKFIFKDVSATVALASTELASSIPPETGAILITLSGSFETPISAPTRHRKPVPSDLAYVMYTSGSTGTPKGVGLSHDAAAQALLAHDRHVPSFSRFLQFAAPTFDVSVFEIFFPLFRGSTLVSVRREEMLDDLPHVLREMDIDACELTPTVAASLLRKRQNAPDLRLLLTIGEMLNGAVVQEFGGDADRDSMLWAMYGPTEATIHCTLQIAFSSESSTGNIGVPLDTVSCFVVEPADSPGANNAINVLPAGEVGELAVGGHQLATEYLNRPEQTSAVFVTSTYGRLYRTGDKARVRPDGTLECLGRLSDGQVKLRGQRLELGEVEQAVMRAEGCHNAVAAVVDSILVAFCAVDAGVQERDIMQKCKDWLPSFMVPGEVVLMKDMPRLPSGKVDRKKLRSDFEDQKAVESQNDTGPGSLDAMSELILRIVSETIDGQVDMRTTLSSAGIESLRAIKLASSLRSAGLDISVTELLNLRTASDLCDTLRRRPTAKTSPVEPVNLSMLSSFNEIAQRNPSLKDLTSAVEDILPCAPLQSAMLAETLRVPGLYWNEMELETPPDITAEQIALAFHQLVCRNEILRTGFLPWSDGFVSIVFREPPDGLVGIVDELHPGNDDFQDIEGGFPPYRVRIQRRATDLGPRVLIRMHHAIYDGWSMDMMLSDVSQGLRGTAPISRPPFSEAIKFHKQSSTRDLADADRAFWSEHLLGWSNTRFPKLMGRLPESSETMVKRDFLDLAPEKLARVSQRSGCGTQTFFQASLAMVWSGVLGTPDIVMGSVTSGRSILIPDIERMLGPCIASMPLRVDFRDMNSNLDALNSIKSSNRAIMDHCILPLSEVKKLAGLQAGDGLYDVLFVYQESVGIKDRNNDLVREVRHLDRLETKLLLEVEPRDDGFALQATYKADSFPPDFISHLMQQLKSAVGQFLDNPQESLQFTRASIEAPRSIYNDDPTGFEGVSDLAKAFETTEQRSPAADALCLAFSIEPSSPSHITWSYQRLNKLSNQIARFLRAEGGETDEVVAIVMEKSINLYASILGIVKAGCAYLPMLPSTPIARMREIFRQAGVKHCLIDGMLPLKSETAPNVRFLDLGAAPLETFESSNLDIPADPSRLAYVIYTSGTTGVPKGVAVTQNNIVSNINLLESVYPVRSRGTESRLLQACSHAFDVSVFEIFFTWRAGMCLCAATNDVLFADLEQAIRQLEITHLSLTPTVASLIDPKNVPRVEFLVTAGEPMTSSVLEKWDSLLWQGYGPSETTNICSVKRMCLGEHIEHLGWVFPNTSVFVLFPNTTEAVPNGWVGEFCFGGDQIAHGYLNMPELTGDKFIEHPRAGRIYRSGDMGRMLADGSLVILGRIDDQIKLRGQRIEAGEISSVITATSLATSAVTMLVRREDKAPEQLASFYVPRENKEQGAQASTPLEIQDPINRHLLASLRSQVPSYMLPTYLIPVPRIPLTSSGKVDHRALRARFEQLPSAYLVGASDVSLEHATYSEWTATESSLADVVAQRRGIRTSEVGRWTPFATLGLDSVSAIGVSRDLTSVRGARVPISAILQHPTIAQLARYLDNTSSTATETAKRTQPISESFLTHIKGTFFKENKKVSSVLPCTPLQAAMLSRGQGSYYNKTLLRLRINYREMREYWSEMSRRHGVLRTCFVTTDDADHPVVQVVLRDWVISWRTFDVSVPSLDGAIHDHLKNLPDPLDSHSPPVSLALIRYKGSVFLSFICHHALYDGVAMENLWREIEALANGIPLLPPVPYMPFIQEALDLPSDVDAFWADHFNGFRPSTLFGQPTWGSIDQCTHTSSLEMPFNELQERLRSLGISLLSLCQATWANVLAVSSDLQDVCFGNVMSGRTVDIDGIDRLVAPCFNTIPIRKDVSKSAQNLDLVKTLHRLNSDLLRYQFTPLRRVQKITSRQRRGLFDTLLLLQQPLHDMDEKVWTLEEDSGDMDIPLVCEVVPCPSLNSLVINIHHDMSIVAGAIATTFADVFKYLLRAMLCSPYSPPADRQSLPSGLRSGLSGLAARIEKADETRQLRNDHEDWSDIEARIRQVLSDLSGVSANRIRRDTSIFQLGLDSINAVQVASMMRRQGSMISGSDVIECTSCTKMASRIVQNSQLKDPGPPKYDLERFSTEVAPQLGLKFSEGEEIEAVLPCTHIQSAMLSSFLQSGGRNYLNVITFEVDQRIQADALKKAWKSVCNWHPMLRTGFLAVQHRDTSFAMVRRTRRFEPSILALENAEAHAFDASRWKAETGDTILRNLHLPPWTLALVENDGRLVMHILIHHALYDAQSLEGILDALSKSLHYRALDKSPEVRHGLSSILSKSLHGHDEGRNFWQRQAAAAVVNSFPVLTPLREPKRIMLKHEMASAMSFSEMLQRTRDLNYTIQAVVQAAWTRVLSSYLGEDAVVFGVTLSGRTTDETKDVPMPCLTTLPVIASNQSSNSDLVRSMIEYNAQMRKHQFAPLSQVQKWLGHPATPVFDTLLAYQRMERDRHMTRPWKLVEDDATLEYPVSLEVQPSHNDAVQLRTTFFGDFLPKEQAALIAQQFDATMADLLRNEHGTQEAMFKKQPHLFSIELPASSEIFTPIRFLHQFVEQRALLDPEGTALEFVSDFDGPSPVKRTWSYKDLDGEGNRVANMLKEHASPGSIVALHFDKCPEAYFSILGILKAGCAFVALDPSAPAARKEFILQDSSASCLLTDVPEAHEFEAWAKAVLVSETALREYPASSRHLGDQSTPSSTCYCLYTSGTTGTPKGCEITHENAVQAMMAFQELFAGHWDGDSRWLQFAALHFDVSVLEQYWSWSVGITVVAAPKDLILDDLIASIYRLGITHIDLTPSLARLTHPDDVPSLCKGVFITGGEQLKQEILDAWGPKAVIYNAYGPTEATIGVTMYQRVPVNGRPSNIGKQFPNVGSYVFRQGTETPVLRGGIGELCVSGKLVGKGYLNRPELTDERFPTLSQFGERVYRTGDLVRLLHNGCFEFLGRADDQVKLRGQRLEIGEIDHAIRTGAPQIQDVTTIVTRHGSIDKDLLVSFLVSERSDEQALRALQDEDNLGASAKAACRDRLPGYMIPTYFLRLPYIPLSANNKAETKELKSLFAQLSNEQLMDFTATRKPTTSHSGKAITNKLIRVLSQFSGTNYEDISESTSLFDIGVDSITALQLSSLLKSRGFEMATPVTLVKNPIVADLAHALTEGTPTRHLNAVREAKLAIQACHHRYRGLVCRTLGVKPEEIEYIAPCSPLQQGIISKAMTGREPGAYFNSFELEVHRSASLRKLQKAWGNLIATQPILRTAFVNTSAGCVQVALNQDRLVWEQYSIPSIEEKDRFLDTKKREWVSGNQGIIRTPLQFIHLEGPGTRKLIIHIFHAIYDGNSFDLMMQQVAATYQEEKLPQGPSFLEALAHGPLWKYDDCREFWADYLRGWTFWSVPSLSPSKETASVARRKISTSLLEGIRRTQNVTLQSVLLALWTSTLQTLLPGGVTIGVVVAGRSINLPGVERTVGPLFNTVPYFSRASDWRSLSSLIQACHNFNAEILPFQHVPLQKVQKWCSGGRPLFDNLFTFQLEQRSPVAEAAVPWEMVESPPNPDYRLAFEATRTVDGELQLLLVAQPHVADAARLEHLLDRFEESIASAAEDADRPRNSPDKPAIESHGLPQSTKEQGIDGSKGAEKFSWTTQAVAIRSELCALVDAPAGEVTPFRTIFELGLDSIDVMKLSARLKKMGIDLSASQIMRQQTIAKVCQLVEDAHQTSTEQKVEGPSINGMQEKLEELLTRTGFDMAGIESTLPPTPLQESMVVAMVESEFRWYYNHDVLEISETVQIPRLREAWRHITQKSPILRTGFLPVDAQDLDMAYCQVVFKDCAPCIRDYALTNFAEVEEVMADATNSAREGHARNKLFQLAFVKLGGRNLVVVSIAHALYDGWSLNLMYRNLEATYRGKTCSEKSAKPFLERALLSATSQAREFWADYLDGASRTLLPERADSASSQPAVASKSELPSHTKYSEISAFCKAQSISLQVLCQACWAVVLARRTGLLDVTFGVVLSGRDFDGAEDLMFPTMNTVVLRCVLHGSVASFLAYLEETMADIREFQAFPLRKAQLAAKAGGPELFNSLFMLQKSAENPSEGALFKSMGGSAALDYPVCVEAEAVGERLVWRAACQARYLSKTGSTSLLWELDQVLQFMVARGTSDVLNFQDQGVSICGRPAVSMKDHSLEQDTSLQQGALQNGEHWNETSSILREVLSQVANVDRESVTAYTSLYHLGLDSISAIKMSTLLRKRGLLIKTRDLLKSANIQQMADLAVNATPQDETQPDGPHIRAPLSHLDTDGLLAHEGIPRDSVKAVIPAVPMQVYMMSAWQNAEGAVFFPEFRYRIQGTVEPKRVHDAWRSLVRQTPILRTRFVPTGSRETPLLQVIVKHGGTRRQPLAHFDIIRDDSGNSSVLRLKIHHALYDGVSLPSILRKLCALLHDGALKLQDNSQPWIRYAIRPTLTAAKSARQGFWTRYLEGCTTDPPDAVAAQGERVSYLRRSAVADANRVRLNASQRGISIHSLFFAAYAKVLSVDRDRNSSSGGETVVFGIYLANHDARDESGIDSTYPTLNLVPLRVRVDRKQSLVDIAAAVQEDLHRISSEGREQVGLWEIAAWTGVKVTSFVNFLGLPAGTQDYLSSESGDTIKLEPVEPPKVQPAGSWDDAAGKLEGTADARGPWLAARENIVRDAFPAAIDVEASIQGGGLDVGVFGSRGRISQDGAAKLVDDIVAFLGESVTSGG